MDIHQRRPADPGHLHHGLLSDAGSDDSTVSGNGNDGIEGGGIQSENTPVTLINSTVSGNTAMFGGGFMIKMGSVVAMTNSTVSGNSVTQWGGGISCESATIALTNSTVSGNTSASTDDDHIGGGIRNYYCESTLTNSIIANNGGGPDCGSAGTFNSEGYNLDSDGTCALTGVGDLSNTDPQLGPLADNGGPTLTHGLLEGSPAIDAIPTSECELDVDQRGESRPQGTGCDIGAFELTQQ